MDSRTPPPLLPLAYGIGAMMVISPPVGVFLSAWPAHPSEITWRFGILSLFGNILLWPVIGVTTLALTAQALEHRRFLRLIALASALGSLVLLVLSGLFALDVLQLRSQVRPGLARSYDLSAGRAFGAYLFAIVMEAWLGWSGSRAARRPRHRHEGTRTSRSLLARGAPVEPPAAAQQPGGSG